jgi:hypothetical protein
MTAKETEEQLRSLGVESKLNIAQPWILWRMKTSSISLSEVAKIIEESEVYESTDDD